MVDEVKRTFAVPTVVVLHLVAVVSCLLVFWLQKRGPGYPPPKVEVAW